MPGPVTIKVNGMFNSLVHKGSIGITMSTVPDVCKTPSPGGPVPIPYPIIVSQSAMLTKGTKTVKVDGKKMAAVKGSEFSMCNGDEPGVAGGVVSSTNMKEAAWILYSFDVKMDGKNACRLMDKMFMNHKNTVSMVGCLQGPVLIDMSLVGDTQEEACEKLKEKEVQPDTPEAHAKAAERAGMREDDYGNIREVCKDNNCLASFRQTNPAARDKIGTYPCKPAGFNGSKSGPDGLATCADTGKKYASDYDMHDMITSSNGNRVRGGSTKESKMIRRMNQAMDPTGKHPRVMHGCQANYGDYLSAAGKEGNPENLRPAAEISKQKPVTAFDADGKVYQLESNEDVANMYRCKGTNFPKEWNVRDKATGKKVKPKIK